MGIKIVATGRSIPDYIVTNADLMQLMDTNDEWICKRTGIKTRHVSQSDNTSQLGYKAAKQALKKANIQVSDIKFIIVATMSPDFSMPSTACLIQEKLGAKNAFAFDINAACSGFIYALQLADSIMSTMQDGYGLVIGSDVMSKCLDWSDRSTAILFGDAAGCVVVKSVKNSHILAHTLCSDGEKSLCLTAGEKPVLHPFLKQHANQDVTTAAYLSMQGREVFNFATRQIPKIIEDTLTKTHYTLNQIDYYLLHQANSRIIEIVAKKLALPLNKFPTNLEKYGNTSSASIPVLLDELLEQGTLVLNSQQLVLMAGFGGGLTWGAQLMIL